MRVQEHICDDCGARFTRYSTLRRFCDTCTRARAALKQSKQRKPLPRAKKPIKQRGKEYNKWVAFRNGVVRPYLDKKYGRGCFDCGVMPARREDGSLGYHDVDHVKGKGAHAELKGDLTNFVYRCRVHHIGKTGVPQWTNHQTPGIDKNAMRAELDAAAKAVREAAA
ncbi:hypothetical protein AB0P19_07015 [Microbacterium oleivorans]|uniref:hypothetical protein n=1 Tax=Microbacterium oleivorans TaxID=273677 RepID=UPI0033EB509A